MITMCSLQQHNRKRNIRVEDKKALIEHAKQTRTNDGGEFFIDWLAYWMIRWKCKENKRHVDNNKKNNQPTETTKSKNIERIMDDDDTKALET